MSLLYKNAIGSMVNFPTNHNAETEITNHSLQGVHSIENQVVVPYPPSISLPLLC